MKPCGAPSAGPSEQLPHGVGLRMHLAHRRFNVIVPRNVLQRRRVRVFADLDGGNCVPEATINRGLAEVERTLDETAKRGADGLGYALFNSHRA